MIKYIDYSYTPGYSLAVDYFAPREILKTCSSHNLYKNSIDHLLTTSRDYYRPPSPKVLEMKWTIYVLYIYVHFPRVFVEFVVLLTKIWRKKY